MQSRNLKAQSFNVEGYLNNNSRLYIQLTSLKNNQYNMFNKYENIQAHTSLLSEPSQKNINETTMRTSCPINEQQEEHSQQFVDKSLKIIIIGQNKLSNTHQEYQSQLKQQEEVKSLQLNMLRETKKSFKRDNPLFTTFGAYSDYQDDQVSHFSTKQQIMLKNNHHVQEQKSYHPFERNQANRIKQLVFLNSQQTDIKEKQPIAKSPNVQTQCFFQVSSKNVQRTTIKILKSKINLGPLSIDMKKIMKIKIYPAESCSEKSTIFCKNQSIENYCGYNQNFKMFAQCQKEEKQNVIKITTADNVFHFSQRYPKIILPMSKQAYSPSIIPTPEGPSSGLGSRLPLPFKSFSRIILKKLKQLYPTIKSTQWEAPQFQLRALIKQNNKILPPAFNKYNKKNFAFIHGKIYKKSQHKAKWQKRYIIVNEAGIYSYKNESDESYSFSIEGKSIKYMWTWFTILKVEKQKDKIVQEIDQQNDEKYKNKNLIAKEQQQIINENQTLNKNQNAYLIIKMKHGFNDQTQFGIPICGFDNQMNKIKNWLFAFYKLLSQYQY